VLDAVAGQVGGVGRKAAEGLAGAFDTLAQRFEEARLASGNAIAPATLVLVNALGDALEFLAGKMEYVTFAATGLGAALLAIAARAVIGKIVAVGASILTLGAQMGGAAAAARGLSLAMRSIPFVGIAAALGTLIPAYFAWRDAQAAATREALAASNAESTRANAIEMINLQIGEQILKTDDARSVQEQLTAAIEDGTIVLDEATGSYRLAGQTLNDLITASQDAARAQLDLARAEVAPELRAQAEAIAAQAVAAAQAAEAADLLTARILALAPAATDAATKISDIVAQTSLIDPSSLNALLLSLGSVREESAEAAKQIEDALAKSIKGLNDIDLSAFAEALQGSYQVGVIGAQELETANRTLLEEGFKRLGTTFDKAISGIETSTQRALATFKAVSIGLNQANLSAEELERGLLAAFAAAAPKVQTLEGLEELIKSFDELKESGQLTAETMELIDRLLARQRAEIEKLDPAVRRLEEAYRFFGLTGPQALQEAAEAARENYDVLKESEAPINALRVAFGKYAQAAIAANNGVVDSSLRAEAAQLGLKIEADDAGRITVSAMNQAAAATANVAREARAAAVEYRGMAAAAGEVADAVERAESAKSGERPRSFSAYVPKNLEGKTLEQLQELLRKEENRLGVAWMLSKEEVESRLRPIREAVRAAELERIAAERQMIDIKAKAEELGIRALNRSKEELELLIAKAELESVRNGRSERQPRPQVSEQPAAGGTGIAQPTIPVRTVRLQIGAATLDAPEEQAEAFVRELESASRRTLR
jgi:hypothetical protein